MTRKDKVLDWWADRPATDHLPAALATGATYLGFPLLPAGQELGTVLVGVSALSGLILATGTFAAQMMSQSQNAMLSRLVRRHRPTLNRNWGAILRASVLSAGASLILAMLAAAMPHAAACAGAYVLTLVITRGLRAIHWVNVVNTADEIADKLPAPAPLPAMTMPPETHPRRSAS